MKTALELLDQPVLPCRGALILMRAQLELIAERAREEMRELAAYAAIEAAAQEGCDYGDREKEVAFRVVAAIRKLPVKP